MHNLLKPFILILLVGSIAIATSCNDKEGESFVATEIVGSWNYSSFDFSATINGVDFLKWFTSNLGGSAGDFEGELEDLGDEFNEYEGLELTFNESGSVVASFPGEPDDEGSWELNETNQTLSLDFDDEALVFDVITLTSSALVVSLTEGGEFPDLDEDGTNEILEATMTIGMTK